MRGAEARLPGQGSAWWVLAAFALAALAAGPGRVPEPVLAGALALLFGVATARRPANGLVALLLASAFLLGEHKTPYFLLAHAAALWVLLSFLGHRLRDRLPLVGTHAAAALLFVAAAVVALPLNLRDLLEDLWLVRSLDWPLMVGQGIPDISHLKYLERVAVLALGAGLFVAASQPAIGAAVVAAFPALAVLVGAVGAFGLLRFFGVVHTSGQYLTLSFWTWQNPDLRLTAVAWNPDYLAQFLVLAVPLAVTVAWTGRRGWVRTGATLAGLLGALALVFTFQRAAYLALLVALGVLAWLRWRGGSTRSSQLLALLAAGLGVLIVGAALDAFVLHGRVSARLGRFAEDPTRLQLWAIALRMAGDHPLLGVGSGRYAFFFQEYVDPALRPRFGPFWGTAHSTYLHLLAEQGLIGLASFAVFFGGVWLRARRRLPGLPGDRRVRLGGVLAALAGWFAYGLVQYTFRVDALVYLVCILAGAAVALAPAERPAGLPRRVKLAAVGLAVVALAWRADVALGRPVSPGYEAGFYRWERQEHGRPARWTRGRAAMTPRVDGRVLELRFQAPIPGVGARPQAVRVWVDRQPARLVRLADPGWQTLAVPVERPRGAHVLVELEVAYTFVPSRLGASRDGRTLGVMVGEPAWREG